MVIINKPLPSGNGAVYQPATFLRGWDDKIITYKPFRYGKYSKQPGLRLLRRRRAAIDNLLYPTLGADPEIFVKDGDGNVVPAWCFLPAKSDGGRYFWDGWQAEFRTRVSGTCLAYFTDGVRRDLLKLNAYVRHKLPQGARLVLDSVVPVKTKGVSAERVALGCEPSLNAYGEPPLAGLNPRQIPFRFAGGHIHLGFSKGNFVGNWVEPVVKGMDRIVGLSAVCLAHNLDNQLRRRFYGRAGEYRLHSHRLEYRVLSNFWLCAPEITHITYELARMGATLGATNQNWLFDGSDADVQAAINETDPDAAYALLRRNERLLKRLFKGTEMGSYRLTFDKILEMYWEALKGGVEVIITDPHDLSANWHFGEKWAERPNNSEGTWGHLASHRRSS